MKRSTLLVPLMAMVYSTAIVAQPIPQATPESVGMSSERLGRIGEAVEREIADDRMPGAVVAIARHGKLIYYEAFGYQDKAAGVAMPKDAIFSIASMTKPIVAVAALTLFEQGKLMLNEPIGTYVSELGHMRVAIGQDPARVEPAGRQPTVQDLMRHTAGFTNGSATGFELHKLYPAFGWQSRLSEDELVAELASLPLHHQPGTTWDYGMGFDILGIAIERMSGQSHGEFLDENVFTPLGMTDTFFEIPRNKLSRHASPLPQNPINGEPQSIRDHSSYTVQCGGGCLASTAMDYMTFAQMLLNQGTMNGQRILGRKTVEFMTSDHTTAGVDLTRLHAMAVDHLDGYGFGLGVAVRRGSGTGGTMGSRGEFHWTGAFGTGFWVDPVEDLVIVYMAQTPGAIRRYYRQFIPALVYQALDD